VDKKFFDRRGRTMGGEYGMEGDMQEDAGRMRYTVLTVCRFGEDDQEDETRREEGGRRGSNEILQEELLLV
jgi:hypothetical protein